LDSPPRDFRARVSGKKDQIDCFALQGGECCQRLYQIGSGLVFRFWLMIS
jgi:hypothetical protein